LPTPIELGESGAVDTNPGQLLAAGYFACFLSGMKLVGGRDKISVPADEVQKLGFD
jgi:osmotically inducible protein OsmC